MNKGSRQRPRTSPTHRAERDIPGYPYDNRRPRLPVGRLRQERGRSAVTQGKRRDRQPGKRVRLGSTRRVANAAAYGDSPVPQVAPPQVKIPQVAPPQVKIPRVAPPQVKIPQVAPPRVRNSSGRASSGEELLNVVDSKAVR